MALSAPPSPFPDRAARLAEMCAIADDLLIHLGQFVARLTDTLPPDIYMNRLERSTMGLWRLTAVHKSLEQLALNPKAPISPTLSTEFDSIGSDIPDSRSECELQLVHVSTNIPESHPI